MCVESHKEYAAWSIHLRAYICSWLVGVVKNLALDKYADFIADNRMNRMFGLSIGFFFLKGILHIISTDMSGGMEWRNQMVKTCLKLFHNFILQRHPFAYKTCVHCCSQLF